MGNAVQIGLLNFALVYLLLVVIIIIMKARKIDHTKLLLIASIRMTIQLTLAGYVLMYLFENPSPILISIYLLIMCGFAVYRILAVNKGLNKKFQAIIALSLSVCAFAVIAFFVVAVINVSFFNPQYTIPISGMVLGNAMTGISLGVRTFMAKIKDSRLQIEVLLNQSATPKSILMPMVNSSLETALLPTINSLLGMGIVSLPGMMTGQILSGESPTSAILYQIAVMICIATVVCTSVFLALYFGHKTLYNSSNRFVL